MDTLLDVIFLSTVIAFFNHELDAVKQEEWRFFFQPFGMKETTAYRTFVFAHVILFGVILWFMDSPDFRIGLAIFAIIHAILHWVLRHHPNINFSSIFSGIWIYGGALLGSFYLLLLLI